MRAPGQTSGTGCSNRDSRMVADRRRMFLILTEAVIAECRCGLSAMTLCKHGECRTMPERSHAAQCRMSDDGDAAWRGRSPRKPAAPAADFRDSPHYFHAQGRDSALIVSQKCPSVVPILSR